MFSYNKKLRSAQSRCSLTLLSLQQIRLLHVKPSLSPTPDKPKQKSKYEFKKNIWRYNKVHHFNKTASYITRLTSLDRKKQETLFRSITSKVVDDLGNIETSYFLLHVIQLYIPLSNLAISCILIHKFKRKLTHEIYFNIYRSYNQNTDIT